MHVFVSVSVCPSVRLLQREILAVWDVDLPPSSRVSLWRLNLSPCLYVLGQVLTRKNIEDVIKFAKREKLFILADEVSTPWMFVCCIIAHLLTLLYSVYYCCLRLKLFLSCITVARFKFQLPSAYWESRVYCTVARFQTSHPATSLKPVIPFQVCDYTSCRSAITELHIHKIMFSCRFFDDMSYSAPKYTVWWKSPQFFAPQCSWPIDVQALAWKNCII